MTRIQQKLKTYLAWASQGKSHQEIASLMGVGISTISYYRQQAGLPPQRPGRKLAAQKRMQTPHVSRAQVYAQVVSEMRDVFQSRSQSHRTAQERYRAARAALKAFEADHATLIARYKELVAGCERAEDDLNSASTDLIIL